MKKKIGVILFVLLFFTSSATAFNGDVLEYTAQPESVEELSSKIESSFPSISREDADELAEVIQLIRELKREIYLTGQLLGIREEEKSVEEATEEAVEEAPFIVPEETLVAKQISEEPEKSLPREEKSLIRELEKEQKLKERFIPAAAVRRPEIYLYTKEELERGKLSIVIEKEQTILIPAVKLKRFMVTEPRILKAVKIDENKISVTAMDLGRAFLHIWDIEGRRTIKFRVIQKGYEMFAEARRAAIEAVKVEPFRARYSFDRYRLNSKSDNATRSLHYTEWFHRLAITGETPWGMTNSRFQYEGREYGGGTELQRDLTAWDFNLIGDELELFVGDTGARFSEITLPHTSYQGFRFRNPDAEKINYDVVWGARGARLWGYRVLDWDTANYFYGARGQIEPADFIHFNATALRALEDEEDIGEYLYATGGGLNFLEDAIKIEGEFARQKSEETDIHNHAFKIDTTIELEDYHLTFKGTYRDVEPNFLLVTGSSVPHVGELGYYFDAYYNPFKYLRLTGQYNVFRSRYNFNPTETQRYNRDWLTTLDFDIGKDTRFSYGTWERMREGESSPTRGYGQTYQLSHNFSWPKVLPPIGVYLRYIPIQYRNLTDNSSSYKERKYTCGLRMNVLKNLYYDLSREWYHRKMLESGEHGTVKSLSTGLLYSAQILNTPLYGSCSLRYYQEQDVMNNLPITTAEDVVSSEAELRYRPSSDFETYFRLNYRHIRGVLDHDRNRQEVRIYGGGSYLFDTTLRWGVGGSIKGYVFKDANANGEKDPDEKGIAGIDVYADELYSTTTDADGKFEFRRVKGIETSVMFDTTMLPEGYKPTTPNPQTVKLEPDFVSEVYFGVMAIAEISGVVFNDINMNGIFDEGDEAVKDALLTLADGTMAQTMARGYYRMENVKSGTAELTLDVTSIPSNFIPVIRPKRTIEVEEGKYYEEDFPLYALRTIVGTVFIDKNGNNRFDPGEEGVADIELKVEDNITLTDEAGRFFLKKLKGGPQKVEVNVESMPEEFEIVGDAFKEVMLAPEGEIKEHVDFPLKTR